MRPLTLIPVAMLLIAACSLRSEDEAAAQNVASETPAATASTEAPDAPYPATAVLDAFRQACSDLGSLGAAERRIAASGWTRVSDPSTTPVGELVAFGREQGAKMLEGKGKVLNEPTVFRRTVEGEELHLILSGVVMQGSTVLGCRLYDVGETRRVTPQVASAWLGREPVQTIDRKELMRASWTPGLADGQDSFELYFVPADSPIIAMVKLSGVAMKADQVGSTVSGTQEKQ